jgi:hypothetical protein
LIRFTRILNLSIRNILREGFRGVGLSSEEETRKLLGIREDLEGRIGRLQVELDDLRTAVAEIDRYIARQGFRQPTPVRVERPQSDEGDDLDSVSVRSKDGTILGHISVDEDEISFTPREGMSFATSIPPFQSFLVDRVLENMRATDEGRVTEGELSPEEVLSFEVSTEGERITGVRVRNYGGERRLREIQSSLRWTFDKMYEKVRQG